LINKIEVDKDGNVDIYLRLIGDLGLDETVLIEGDENTEEKGIKTVSNSCNHT
jgi:site-specific DNA recombinase